ncbi:hypothetical protein ABMA28_015805, partial [Loxostege sticticalis]
HYYYVAKKQGNSANCKEVAMSVAVGQTPHSNDRVSRDRSAASTVPGCDARSRDAHDTE